MNSVDRRWNRLADRMSYFHNHLSAEFDTIYAFSDGSFSKIGMSLQAYLRMVMQFHEHLNAHHSIEEAYVFPVLAQRMPVFANDERHTNSHKVIHQGLDKLQALVSSWKDAPTSFSPDSLRACLDDFRGPLFTHLEEEVRDLSADNIKKYYTLEEVDRLPM